MSNYEEFLNNKPKAAPKKGKKSQDTTLNLLTIVMLVLTMCACVFFVSIFMNPYAAWNPLKPNTPVPPPPTATWTPLKYDATWTATVTVQPTETYTPRPTFTVEPSFTPFSLATATPIFTPTETATPTRTVRPTGVPFTASVSAVESTQYQPNSSCESMYIAGVAFGEGGSTLQGFQVKLGGSVPGKVLTNPLITLTGFVQVYGPSGFEFDLKIAPTASKNSLWIQLLDQTGLPLTEQIYLTTYSECSKNMVYVRFQKK